jgi:Tfp pilus assembly protein FimT
MIRNLHKTRSRGTSLVELMTVLALLAVFSVLVSELFVICLGATKSSNRREETLHRVDSLVMQLRRDVWDARHMTASASDEPLEQNVLTLTTSQGPITWKAATAGVITRTDGTTEQKRTWQGLPKMRWEPRGAALTVYVGEGPTIERMTLVSQVMLAGGAQ